jgi:Alginate lyase
VSGGKHRRRGPTRTSRSRTPVSVGTRIAGQPSVAIPDASVSGTWTAASSGAASSGARSAASVGVAVAPSALTARSIPAPRYPLQGEHLLAPAAPRRQPGSVVARPRTGRIPRRTVRVLALVVGAAMVAGAGWLGLARPRAGVAPRAVPAPATAAPGSATPVPAPPSVAAPPPSSTKPPTPPLTPISLAGWKLTIPEASDKGTAASVNPANSAPPWLIRDGNGSLKFWAPVDGATTENSEHPRTELVSLTNFKAGTSPHTLAATLAVIQAPTSNQDIIIGQIHGADDIKSVPFVMLHYSAGAVRVVVKQAQSGSASDKYPLISGVPLGARFSFTISDAGNGSISFAASYGATNRSVTVPIPAPFRNATVRFQAGAYQQGESSGGAGDGARITFYSLREAATSAS